MLKLRLVGWLRAEIGNHNEYDSNDYKDGTRVKKEGAKSIKSAPSYGARGQQFRTVRALRNPQGGQTTPTFFGVTFLSTQ
jgi:hypothetical protein